MGARGSESRLVPTRRRLLALVLDLGLVVAACGDSSDEAADGGDAASDGGAAGDDVGTGAGDEGEPVRGKSISVAFSTEKNSWRPGAVSWGITGEQIGFAIMDPLMARTAEGTVEPYLAESLEANEDLTGYTLTLRDGVTFHDGTPLNAEAIKSSFDTYLKAEDSNVAGVLENVTAFEVTGELTGVYQLAEASAAFPDLLTSSSGMPFSPTAAEEMGEDYGANPVGHRSLPVRELGPGRPAGGRALRRLLGGTRLPRRDHVPGHPRRRLPLPEPPLR